MELRTHVFGKYKIEAPANSKMDVLCQTLKIEFPNLKMFHKRDVWYHRVVHWLIVIFTFGMNRKYIGNMTTTTKDTICWSDHHHNRIKAASELDRVWETARHERVHLRQFAKRGWFLMALIFLFPPFLFTLRATLIEKDGYLESIRAKWENNKAFVKSERYKKWWMSQFTGANYGWMLIWKSRVEKWFDDEVANLERKSTYGSARV